MDTQKNEILKAKLLAPERNPYPKSGATDVRCPSCGSLVQVIWYSETALKVFCDKGCVDDTLKGI
jgi:ribosomal protein S27E